ncbi:MAG: glycosyltransferase family 39 protein [Anaerolineales bacterium]|nr:glycosyltransferase family 39 protein [Anaerolineales bacterium]
MNDDSDKTDSAPSRIARWRLAAILAYLLASGAYWFRTYGQPLNGPPQLIPLLILLLPLGLLLLPYWPRTSGTTVADGTSWLWRPLGWLQPYVQVSGLQLILLSLSVLLIYFILMRIPILDAQPDASYQVLFWSWLLAIGLFAAAVLNWRSLAPRAVWVRWQGAWRGLNRPVWLTLAAIVLVAALLRLWQLGNIPYILAGDEGAQGLEAVKVIDGEIRNPFSTGWLGVPTMSFFYNSWTIRLLGRTILALRLPWAVVGVATVLAAFLLGRQLKGTRYGLLMACFLAVYHYHIHFSRLGSNQVADPLFASLALFFLQRAIDKRALRDWFLTGAISGLAFYFYAGARLTPVLVLAVLAYHLLFGRSRFWRTHYRGMVLTVATFLLVGAPMFQYANRYPDEFNARVNQVGIIQSGWLEREVEITGQSVPAILFDQFRRSALAFNYYPDRTVWYGLREPLLGPWFGTLFLLGLGFVSLRTFIGRPRDERLAPITAWWWGGVILGGMLTESPPSSQRLITLAVPTCFVLAAIVWELVDLAVAAWPRLTGRWLATGVGLLFAMSSIWLYFGEFTPQRLYGGPQAKVAMELVPALQAYDEAQTIYFAGAPRMYWGFATLPYLLPGRTGHDIHDPLLSPPPRDPVQLSHGLIYVFLPERLPELELVIQAYPEGSRRSVSAPDGEFLAEIYVVPAEP